MRAIFGLVGILVTLGVIVWIMAAPGGELDQISAAKKVKDKAVVVTNTLSGKESDGGQMLADPLTLEPNPGGNLKYLTLTAIDPGGSELATQYGLRVGDEITSVGPLPVGGMSISNVSDAKAMMNSMRGVQTLTVRRNGQTLTLDPNDPQSVPQPAASVAPTNAVPVPGAPMAPAAAERSNPNNPMGSKSLQGILNAGGGRGQE